MEEQQQTVRAQSEDEQLSMEEAELPATVSQPPGADRPQKPVFTSRTIPFVHEEQIGDRQQELRYELDAISRQMEQTAADLNDSIEALLNLDSGVAGFALKAFRGTRVPPAHGRKIDALTDMLEALEEKQSLLQESITLSQSLAARAAKAADIENKRMLRWRALLVLDIKLDDTRLQAAAAELQAAVAALAAEIPPEAPANERAEKGAKEAPARKKKAPPKKESRAPQQAGDIQARTNDLMSKLLTKRRPAG